MAYNAYLGESNEEQGDRGLVWHVKNIAWALLHCMAVVVGRLDMGLVRKDYTLLGERFHLRRDAVDWVYAGISAKYRILDDFKIHTQFVSGLMSDFDLS